LEIEKFELAQHWWIFRLHKGSDYLFNNRVSVEFSKQTIIYA
jgi:hypothetical protein